MKFLVLSGMLLIAAFISQGNAGIENLRPSRPNNPRYAGDIVINNETFFFSSDSQQYVKAEAICRGLGMQMVTLNTRERSQSIMRFFVQNPEFDFNTLTSGQRQPGEENFKWMTTGEEFTYTDWYEDKPSEPLERQACVFFIAYYGGWIDNPCDYYAQVMCEDIPTE